MQAQIPPWSGARAARKLLPAACVALAGCLAIDSPPDDLARSEAPKRQSFASSAAGLQQVVPVVDGWVAAFGDTQLTALVQEALAHNPDLRRAAAAWREAQARVRSARAELWPWLDASGRASRARPVFPGRFQTGSLQIIQASASWEVDLWGRVRSTNAAAAATAEAQRLQLAAARQSLAATVAESWVLAIQARRQLAIDLLLLEAEQRTARITGDKVDSGVGAQLDAQLARANLSLAEQLVTADHAAIDQLVKALEALLGRYPGAELAVADRLPAFPGEIAVGVPAELLERRPDLVAADRRVAAAFHRTEAARAARLPNVTLTASLGQIVDPAETLWSLAGDVFAPLFQGGRLEAAVEAADAQQEQALADYVSTAIDAFREVETALAAEDFLLRREADLLQATTRLEDASRIGEDRYAAGILSIIELIVIRRQDFQSRRTLLQVQSDRIRQRIALHLALGGSFGAAPALQTPAQPDPESAETEDD